MRFGTAAAGNALTVNSASTIEMLGPAAQIPVFATTGYGIRALSFSDAPISVTYTGPGITTFGGNGMGIVALSGGGSIDVTSYGPITTNGTGAVGIFADSTQFGLATLSAPGAEPIVVTPSVSGAPGGSIVVTTSGQGSNSQRKASSRTVFYATSPTGTVQVNARNNILTTGQFSSGSCANRGPWT